MERTRYRIEIGRYGLEAITDPNGSWEYHADAQATVEALQAQLPAEMQECTILFKACEKGHGRLTATNWMDHGCQTCVVEALQAQIARAKESCRCYSNWWDRKIPERPSYEALQQQVEALQQENSQLQALVRALPVQEVDPGLAKVVGVTFAGQAAEAMAHLMTYRATMDAATPAGGGQDE